ncbi:MAG: 4Fe-4S dicluster domain-containing protein, partial [Bacteroidales bacterium]|nr:4Fe-4S dicluster domain-containing protein [Bacteroidales bacterium]
STPRYGDYLPCNQTIVMGPKQEGEIDGPEEMHVIWVDNGRSKIMGYKDQRTILNCIRCGACEALCPVFKFVKSKSGENGHENHDNPLACVALPIERGFDKYAYLSFACTLCGKCQEVCPVRIPLPELILFNRREAVTRGNGFGLNKSQVKTLKKMFLKRKALESSYNKFILKTSGIKKEFGTQRVFPDFSQKSFHVLWSEAAGIYTSQNK